ncbi:MAG: hypothetical protein WB952_23670 [Terriglobales bacterium]
MNRIMGSIALYAVLFFALGVVAQQSSNPPAPPSGSTTPVRGASTLRGCLDGERGNYILIEDNTSMAYVLKGVGNKLDQDLHHEVEVKGRILPGTIKTGVRAEKTGSNPSDTVHGVDGVPLQVADVQTDVRTIAKHCKAADQE